MSYAFQYPWKKDSNCVNTGDSGAFAETEEEQLAFVASFCTDCKTKVACLEAGDKEVFGVWGGLTTKQRIRVHRKRGRFTDDEDKQTW